MLKQMMHKTNLDCFFRADSANHVRYDTKTSQRRDYHKGVRSVLEYSPAMLLRANKRFKLLD